LATLLGRQWIIGSLQFSVGGLLTFLLTIWVSVKLAQVLRFVLEEDVYSRVRLARGLPGTITMLVRYSIVAIGFFVAVAAAGFPLTSFTIVFGALSVGIGFGLQNVVNNFVSGLILAFERPIQLGDTIEVGQLLGEVKSIGIRASTVRTFDGAEVLVPNGDLISAQVINWTLSDQRRRIRVPVGVAYGTDPQRVIDLLTEVAASHEDVLPDPATVVLFRGFGESSLDFEMRFWTSAHDRWMQISSQVAVEVNRVLKEQGIEIPFPQRDLHLRSVDGDAARSLAGESGEAKND
jgi:small-conductance mechanosensitive channel